MAPFVVQTSTLVLLESIISHFVLVSPVELKRITKGEKREKTENNFVWIFIRKYEDYQHLYFVQENYTNISIQKNSKENSIDIIN